MANFRPAAVYGNTGTNHSDIDKTFGAVTATLSGIPETLCVTTLLACGLWGPCVWQ